MIEIHSTAQISPLSDIEDSVRGTRIIISENVIIDSFVKIKPTGEMGDLTIGSDSVINSGCVLYTDNEIKIGKSVAIAANCTLAPVNHEYTRKDISIRKQGFRPSKGGIIISDGVWIGANCTILDGAIFGIGCVIAAGSIVRGVLEACGIYGSNPIVKLGSRK